MSAVETTPAIAAASPTATAAGSGTLPGAPRLTRAERNRRNARHSTGPRTREGKNITRLNASKHGGTAQTVLLPTDDAAAYQKFAAGQLEALAPLGADEAAFAQTIVDTRWQLARTQTFENNLIYLLPAPPSHVHSGNESPERQQQLKTAEAAAKTFFENLHKFDLMSRYSARLSRLIIQNHDKLTKMQTARRMAEREAELNALRHQAISFEHDMAHLPERIRIRMRKLHEEQTREAEQNPLPDARNQQPAAHSGFVSQAPSSTLDATSGDRKTIHQIAMEALQNRAA